MVSPGFKIGVNAQQSINILELISLCCPNVLNVVSRISWNLFSCLLAFSFFWFVYVVFIFARLL